MVSQYSPDGPRIRWKRSAIVLLALAALAGIFWSAGKSTTHDRTTKLSSDDGGMAIDPYVPPSDASYVGSSACAECHSAIAESFQTHPMSRSIGMVDAELEQRLASAKNRRVNGKQRVLEVDSLNGVMRHHEKMFDAEGRLIYDQAVPMTYVVGSGRRAMAFVQQRGDLLFQSPLNWYADGDRWDLAPGYAVDDVRRFDRRITEDCLACHAGRVAATARAVDRYETPAFHEMAIGCENCHGPGKEHIALHRAGMAAGESGDPIVNPARLDVVRRESLCNQCHLQTAVRLPRFGRSDFDFRPGQRFDEIWTALDAEKGADSTGRSRAVSHVQQMRASRCYTGSRESDSPLGCVSCHDPHRAPSETERVAFYRERCLKCHEQAPCTLPQEDRMPKGDSCIDCHMPGHKTVNISHLTQTDHRVLRFAADVEDDVAEPLAEAQLPEQLVFFDNADARLTRWERDRALGLGAWMHLSRKGRERSPALGEFLRDVLRRGPVDGDLLTVLGAMELDQNRPQAAADYYRRAEGDPKSEESVLEGLLKIDYLSGNWEKALVSADRLLEIDPGNARVHAMRADALGELGRGPEAIEAAERSLEWNPSLVPVRQWLSNAYGLAGRTEDQQRQEDILRRMREAPPSGR